MEQPDVAVTSPVRDMGVNREVRHDVDDDASDHRHSSMYIGLRLPKRPKRPSRGNRRSREKREKAANTTSHVEDATPTALSPSEQVQYLLGDTEEGEEHESHHVFCQMDQLHRLGGELEWREAARWVKYEEDVEEGGERWSKPHVASLSLHSLFELRSSLTSGCVMLDMDAYHISQVADLLLDNLINKQLLEESMRDTIRNVLLLPHRHQHQKRRRSSVRPSIGGDHGTTTGVMLRTLSEIGRRFSEHGGLKTRDIRSHSTGHLQLDDSGPHPPNTDSTGRLVVPGAAGFEDVRLRSNSLSHLLAGHAGLSASLCVPTVDPDANREEGQQFGSVHLNIPMPGGPRAYPRTYSHADMQAVAEKYHQQHGNSPLLKRNPHSSPNMEQLNGGIPESASSANLKLNQNFMRKIPDGAEVANIMVGEVDTLKYQVCALVRLCEARIIGDMSEVPIPTRFLFFLLGPTGTMTKMVEIGRSISTIMVDQVFREVAYRARKRQDILAGIDEFLDQVTVLPPGEWDPNIRIEPPASVPSQEARKVAPKVDGPDAGEEEEELVSHCDPTLQRSGRIFGGLIADVRRKIPWYASDFKDCLHIQCFASVIYLFLATLTPNVTFGGLLGIATHNYMGTMECILSAAITGVLFALFAGQPLNILGSTGPMLVLEMILYNFCHDNELDFLPFRVWIGLWTTLILLLIVAFDLSALVRFITRFTEESFACLIAIIFIVEAFKKLFGILDKYPVNRQPDVVLDYTCDCFPNITNATGYNSTLDMLMGTGHLSDVTESTGRTIRAAVEAMQPEVDLSKFMYNGSVDYSLVNWTTISHQECKALNASLVGPGCDTPHYVADVFGLSFVLFFTTFVIAYFLTHFKNTEYFPTFVRQCLSDFAVLIAIILMVGLDAWIGIGTPKLEVPEKFAPSSSERGWFINPMSGKNPWWLTIAAIIPALLATILIFMDQQITAVIVNRKENRLKKGNGYHLDLFIVAICIAICSLLGLPWYVAATVSAIAHIMSLKKESECNAPGEKPVFLGVREQRVTALMVGILSGCSVLFTSVLRIIPMPVLYGVFFYMGVAALRGMQFVDRVALLLMPAKYQPDSLYLRHVPIKRVHLFTLFQFVCIGCLWAIKSVKSVSIVFPIMVLATCFVRKGMDFVFTQRELKYLDDIMPEVSKRAKEDAKGKDLNEEEELLKEDEEQMMGLKADYLKPRGNIRRSSVDTDRVNISEEMAKTAIWLSVRKDSTPQFDHPPPKDGSPSKSKKKKRSKKEKEVEAEESPPEAEDSPGHNTAEHNNQHGSPHNTQPGTGMFFIPGEEPAEIMKEIPEEVEDLDESKV